MASLDNFCDVEYGSFWANTIFDDVKITQTNWLFIAKLPPAEYIKLQQEEYMLCSFAFNSSLVDMYDITIHSMHLSYDHIVDMYKDQLPQSNANFVMQTLNTQTTFMNFRGVYIVNNGCLVEINQHVPLLLRETAELSFDSMKTYMNKVLGWLYGRYSIVSVTGSDILVKLKYAIIEYDKNRKTLPTFPALEDTIHIIQQNRRNLLFDDF